MKALNQTDKAKATKKFVALYALSLLFVLFCSYFLFRTPLKIKSEDAKAYREFTAQQNQFMNRTNRITAQISELIEAEKVIYDDSVSSVESMISDYRQKIMVGLTELKEDSAKNTFASLGNNLNNFLIAYNALLFYSQNNYNLRQIMAANKNSNNKAGTVNTGQLLQAQREKEQLLAEILTLKNKLSATMPAVKETDKTADNIKLTALNNQVRDLNYKLDQAEKDRDRYKQQLAQKTDELRKNDDVKPAVNTQTNTVYMCNEEEQAKALYSTAEQLIKKAQTEDKDRRKGIYMGARVILLKIQGSYPEKQKLAQTLKDVNDFIAKKEAGRETF
ncbi:MAG: hypothetical protein WKF70_09185 [Chitinophagaceae bacterium]